MTRHLRAGYVSATMELAGLSRDEESHHKNTRKSEIRRGEEDFCKVEAAFQNFINPFQIVNKDAVYCISSGAQAPVDIEKDLMAADSKGKEKFQNCVEERLISKIRSFHAPITKLKLKTFAAMSTTVKVTSTQSPRRNQRRCEQSGMCLVSSSSSLGDKTSVWRKFWTFHSDPFHRH